MEDDSRFAKKQKLFAAFVEVTTSQCKLNGPWTDRTKCNMPRAIRALGALGDEGEIKQASATIYETGWYHSDLLEFGLISIGNTLNPELRERMPNVLQIVWEEVKGFIFDRFHRYEQLKRGHPQWDLDGHLLWRVFNKNRDHRDQFGSSLELVATRPTSGEIDTYCRSKEYP